MDTTSEQWNGQTTSRLWGQRLEGRRFEFSLGVDRAQPHTSVEVDTSEPDWRAAATNHFLDMCPGIDADWAADELVRIVDEDPTPVPQFVGCSELVSSYQQEREPLVKGLFRRGDIINLIASPKAGKSWLALNLAVAMAAGMDWLGFCVTQGRVLIVDNELRPETIACRLRFVTDAMGISAESLNDCLKVETLRGRLTDLNRMSVYFDEIQSNEFDLIILDAFYRFLPPNVSENDNGAMTQLYNSLDNRASRLQSAILLIHHASKGDQSRKSVTDVGSGAGSMARAADAHITIRPHETPDMAVFDARVRSFPPVDSLSIKWQLPLWAPKHGVEPALQVPKNKTECRQESKDALSRDEILRAIDDLIKAKDSPKVTHNQLRVQTAFHPDKLNRILKQLKDAGMIVESAGDDKRNTRWFERATRTEAGETQSP